MKTYTFTTKDGKEIIEVSAENHERAIEIAKKKLSEMVRWDTDYKTT